MLSSRTLLVILFAGICFFQLMCLRHVDIAPSAQHALLEEFTKRTSLDTADHAETALKDSQDVMMKSYLVEESDEEEQDVVDTRPEPTFDPLNPICSVGNSHQFPVNGCRIMGISARPHCHLVGPVKIDTAKIKAEKMGGEPLETVWGQPEDYEFLKYEPGAFTVPSLPKLPGSTRGLHYIINVWEGMQEDSSLVNHTDPIAALGCTDVWQGITLMITRYEYVNLYHTFTDWWNTYYSLPTNGRKVDNIVFLDAHPEGNLDPVWTDVFAKRVTFARHIPTGTCFEQVRFIPAGYVAPLNPHVLSKNVCPSVSMGRSLVQHFINAFQLQDVHRIPGRIVVIDRVPYRPHPRAKESSTARRLSQLRVFAERIPQDLLNGNVNITVEVVTLVADTMRDQIASIRQADVLIGNHGAGLTHLMFLEENASSYEMSCAHGFFSRLAQWAPIGRTNHHCLVGQMGDELHPTHWTNMLESIRKDKFAA